MKPSIIFLAAIFLTMSFISKDIFAEGRDVELYYTGDARIIDLVSGLNQVQKVLLKKTLHPMNQSFSEIACFQSAGRLPEISKVYMNVQGNNFEISDSKNFDKNSNLTGSGELLGEEWNWDVLKFHMNYAFGSTLIKIEDVNFISGSKLIGRKQLYLPNGKGFQLYELEMESIDKNGFEQRAFQMKCPPIVD